MQALALTTSSLDSTVQDRALRAALFGLAPNSCRVYTRHLRAFLAHLDSTGAAFTRETVADYLDTLSLDDSSHNQALSAIKRLAHEAAEHYWIDWAIARTVEAIPARKQRGVRTSHWLSIDQAKALLSAPSAQSVAGRRDRAVLALMLGCGLRRDELARLDFAHFARRGTDWVIANIVGKGNRIRTVGCPAWVKAIVDAWADTIATLTGAPATGSTPQGRVVRSLRADGTPNASLSVSAIWDIVQAHAAPLGLKCSPHDLRRTYAELAKLGKAPLEVIQASLGHSSLTTTLRYLQTGKEANAGEYFTL